MSTLLHGTDTLAERMKKDGFENPVFVSVNQKYSAYDNPRHVDKEDKDDKKDDDKKDEDRAKHAIGGVAKHRLDYPDTEGLPKGDHRPSHNND